MIKNYLKIALRQLQKQKMYAAVKIGGFALSITAFLMIALYIKNELSYDANWANADRIYRLTGEFNDNGTIMTGAEWPAPMARALETDYPEVEKAGRLMAAPLFYGAGSNQVKVANTEQNYFEEGFTYADQEMLDMLQMPMVYGETANALSEPNTMVISKSKADKYFPNQNPVGKLMVLNNNDAQPYKIAGVMEGFPKTSHLHYDFLLTMTGHQLWDGEQTTWSSSNYPVYVMLKPGADVAAFKSKLKLILTKYYLPSLKEGGNKNAEAFVKNVTLFAQPITKVHLYSSGIRTRLNIDLGDIKFVWLFGAVAIFILAIACINFINLSTAKSAKRAKEVGLRKVIGSQRGSLVKQFLIESILYSLISFSLALIIALLLLPYFNQMAGTALSLPWTAVWLLPAMIGSAIVIGIIAGIYPAFYLSSFKPVAVLKGQLSSGSRNTVLRNGLVVFQFATSVILIIGTLIIYGQTQFILNRKIGFDRDQVLLIQGTNTLKSELPAFKNELLKSSAIKTVSLGDYLPIAGSKRNGNTYNVEGKKDDGISVPAQRWEVDYDYLETMGMHISEGRYFSKVMASDSGATVINQAMADALGLKKPVGARIENSWQKLTVIGVVDNFNFESMKQDVTPLCLVVGNYNSSIVAAKLSGTNSKDVINHVSAVWKKFLPGQPLRYTFLDESFANMYADVQRTGTIFTSFAVLAIIIACLGLFALSAFMAEQRVKEIGIRKILGASTGSITTMLSKEFLKLVGIAIVIASPVAGWIMKKWLQDFAYRIDITWQVFAIAAGAAIFVALITVSFQSIKAAVANPVDSLRTE